MRHNVAGRKLGRTGEHRLAMLRNLTVSLIKKEKIRTTLMRAKELRPFVEKLITRAKDASLHDRRLLARDVHDVEALQKLCGQIGPRFTERPGGYTRIVKLGFRRGDNAPLALIELVAEAAANKKTSGKSAKPKKSAAKTAPKKSAKDSAETAPEGNDTPGTPAAE